jgi:hypothetical protein
MSFFEAELPPEPERPLVEYRNPPWTGPPSNVVPGTVALDIVLVQTGDAAVWVSNIAASPDGVQLTLVLVRRTYEEDDPDPLWDRPRKDVGQLRFGVGFADGRKAVLDRSGCDEPKGDPEHEIALLSGGGDGSSRRSTRQMWLWPLPPEGPVTLALSWPAAGMPETTVEVDSAPIRAAAQRATELWPDERPLPPRAPEGLGWDAYAAS